MVVHGRSSTEAVGVPGGDGASVEGPRCLHGIRWRLPNPNEEVGHTVANRDAALAFQPCPGNQQGSLLGGEAGILVESTLNVPPGRGRLALRLSKPVTVSSHPPTNILASVTAMSNRIE